MLLENLHCSPYAVLGADALTELDGSSAQPWVSDCDLECGR